MKLTRRGFTLIETIVSIAILLIVVISALLAVINAMFLNESSRNLVTASNDAQYALEQIKTQSFNDIPAYISSYSADTFDNLSGEEISFPNSIYTTNLDTITVQITWNERNAQRTFSTTTRFAQ